MADKWRKVGMAGIRALTWVIFLESGLWSFSVLIVMPYLGGHRQADRYPVIYACGMIVGLIAGRLAIPPLRDAVQDLLGAYRKRVSN